jgi:hypothetical protein
MSSIFCLLTNFAGSDRAFVWAKTIQLGAAPGGKVVDISSATLTQTNTVVLNPP